MFRIANIIAWFKPWGGYYLKINVKTVLEASLLVSDRVPLCSLMIWRDRLRPMPVPSCLVVKNGTKISSWLSLLIGCPSSRWWWCKRTVEVHYVSIKIKRRKSASLIRTVSPIGRYECLSCLQRLDRLMPRSINSLIKAHLILSRQCRQSQPQGQ